jgi:hypothetical protein
MRLPCATGCLFRHASTPTCIIEGGLRANSYVCHLPSQQCVSPCTCSGGSVACLSHDLIPQDIYGPSRDCKVISSDRPKTDCAHIYGLLWSLSSLLALMESARFHLITTATSKVLCPGQVLKASVSPVVPSPESSLAISGGTRHALSPSPWRPWSCVLLTCFRQVPRPSRCLVHRLVRQ